MQSHPLLQNFVRILLLKNILYTQIIKVFPQYPLRNNQILTPFITFLTALTIVSGPGTTLSSKIFAYGIGTSTAVTLSIGASK